MRWRDAHLLHGELSFFLSFIVHYWGGGSELVLPSSIDENPGYFFVMKNNVAVNNSNMLLFSCVNIFIG